MNNADFLSLWDAGHRLHPLDRSLLVIRASGVPPGADLADDVPADWSLGRRNHALAQLHAREFGPALEGWTACSQCGEQLEFRLECQALVDAPVPLRGHRIHAHGRAFRLPTSRDLARVADAPDERVAALRLLANCLVDDDGDAAADRDDVQSWPVDAVDEIAATMADADPLAEIALDVECPACRHASREAVDLIAFLWAEIDVRSRRLLADVHALATSYGWTESAILGLSDHRRAAYLQMVQA